MVEKKWSVEHIGQTWVGRLSDITGLTMACPLSNIMAHCAQWVGHNDLLDIMVGRGSDILVCMT